MSLSRMEILNLAKDLTGNQTELDAKYRPITIETSRGEYIYSDKQNEYSLLLPVYNRSVSNIESLATVVKEEAVRAENPTGKNMTIILTQHGGLFYVDDTKRKDVWGFERELSSQWKELVKNLNSEMTHLDFIRFLSKMRPSIVDYATVSREYKKVVFDANTSVMSQPVIENGNAGTALVFNLTTKNGNADTSLPGEIKIAVPFAKGGSQFYNMTIEVDVRLDEQKRPKFIPIVADIDTITEKALYDEFKDYKELTSELTEQLVVQDY